MGDPAIRLDEGQTAIVGYGSLLSVRSLERTLKRSYRGPFIPCRVEGWRRSWDISMPNRSFYYLEDGQRIYPEKILYLNVRPVPGALLNCVVFVVEAAELAAMHQREWIYHHPAATEELRGVRVEGGEALIYVARPEHLTRDAQIPRQAAVRASYLRILEEGLGGLGPAFQAEYERTTDSPPAHLVVEDVLDQERVPE
ncbi:MAG: hypothetical protein ACRDHY_17850 [Anaerolineales bacterium]